MDFSKAARSPWRAAAFALLAALFAVNLYRAAVQSITHDEALTWGWFLSGPFSQVFGSSAGNHHPLHHLLCKIAVELFGVSEFSLRIPSLLGGLLYFAAAFRLSALLFGERWLFLLSVALLSLNPFTLDYLSCARGYGGAAAFFLWSVYRIVQYLSEAPDPKQPGRPARLLRHAGVALGLSLGFNLTMVIPAAGLVAAVLAILAAEKRTAAPAPAKKKKRERPPAVQPWRAQQALLHFALPATGVGGIVILLPSRLVEILHGGYMGPPSLLAILEGLVRPSLLHAPGRPSFASLIPGDLLVQAATWFLAPAVFAALALFAAITLRRAYREHAVKGIPAIDLFLTILGGALVLSLLAIVGSRYVLKIPYPEQRIVMYWVPLLSLGAMGLAKRFRRATVPLGALLALCVVQFATQFNTRYYDEWAYDSSTKDMMALIRSDRERNPGAPVRLGVTWQLEPAVNFYRIQWGLDWMAPVFRQSPDADFDYYMLLKNDRSLVERRGLKTLRADAASGAVLARR